MVVRKSPLSFSQQRMVFVELAHPNTQRFHIILPIKIVGLFSLEIFNKAMRFVILRHQALRLILKQNDNQLYQVAIDLDTYWQLQCRELIQLESESSLTTSIDAFTAKKMPLFDTPLLQWQIFSLEKNKIVIVFKIHHIIMDGVSLQIFMDELTCCYNAFQNNKSPNLKSLTYQYTDFVANQRQWQAEKAFVDQIKFWQQQLTPIPEPLTLRYYDRPVVANVRATVIKRTIDKTSLVRLSNYATSQRATLYTVLLALYGLLLHKFTQQNEFIIGTPVANRHYDGIENVIGLFVNSLSMKINIDPNQTMNELIRAIQSFILSAQEHQDVPFDRIVEALGISGDHQQHPIFQVWFNFLEEGDYQLNFSQCHSCYLATSVTEVQFDLTVVAKKHRNGLTVEFEYDTSLFPDYFIESFADCFVVCLQQSDQWAERYVRLINPLSVQQLKYLLPHLTEPQRIEVPSTTLLAEFETCVTNYPKRIACELDDRTISYTELNRQAECVAMYLLKQGITSSQQVVALLLPPSLEMVVAIIAILKIGGIYMPLDEKIPAQRLNKILLTSGCRVLITRKGYQLPTDNDICRIVNIESLNLTHTAIEFDNSQFIVKPDALAYIIHTSGSTGEPKAVAVSHMAVLNLLKSLKEYLPMDRQSKGILWTKLAFDVSVYEMWSQLTQGGTLVVLSEVQRVNPPLLFNVLLKKIITHAYIPPFLLNMFSEWLVKTQNKLSLRLLLTGLEPIPHKLITTIKQSLPLLKIINGYGPTECTVCATLHDCDINTDKNVVITPIGRAVRNLQLYVLDEYQQPVPFGAVGELYVSGIGLAAGYYNQSELTSQAFISNPWQHDKYHQKIYRTYDQVRYLADGSLLYVGRQDEQVKRHGYRIELKEVEQALLKNEDVSKAVVTFNTISKKITAYVVAGEYEPDISLLKQQLTQQLPSYMVPDQIIVIEQVPMLPSGKVDKRSLPQPDIVECREDRVVISPRNDIEKVLFTIWQSLLPASSDIGVTDNFFQIGGDSILCILMVTKARDAQLDITVQQIFLNPTIEALAKIAVSRQTALPVVQSFDHLLPYPLAPIQAWFMKQSFKYPHQVCQTVCLALDHKQELESLQRSIQKIFRSHTIFHQSFQRDADGLWQQVPKLPPKIIPIDIIDCQEKSKSQCHSLLTSQAKRMQAAINFNQGPLYKITLFTNMSDQCARLLIVIHHLVVDTLSWRILIDDLMANKAPIIKTHYAQWVHTLIDYAKNMDRTNVAYWKSFEIDEFKQSLYAAFIGSSVDVVEKYQHHITFSKVESQQLLTNCYQKLRANVDEVLIAALAQALKFITRQNTIYINLESHGRCSDIALDVSTTIGWFTNLYPVRINLNDDDNPKNIIKNVRTSLAAVPMQGFSYGVYCYLLGEDIEAAVGSGIVLNYLGQQLPQSDIDNLDAFAYANFQQDTIDITAMFMDGIFHVHINIHHSPAQKSNAQKFCEKIQNVIKSVIVASTIEKYIAYIPEDFPLARLTQAQIDTLVIKHPNLTNIYPLTSLQQGLLFHEVYKPKSLAYFQQLVLTLKGSVQVEILRQACLALLNHYDIFRTVFQWKDLPYAIQCVLSNAVLDFQFLQSNLDELPDLLKSDRTQGISLDCPPLIRFKLIRIAKQEYRFLVSFHHILCDGWSLPIIIKSMLMAYENGQLGKQPLITSSQQPFSRYVKWYLQQPETKNFWSNYLSNVDEKTPLPFDFISDKEDDHTLEFGCCQHRFGNNITQQLIRYTGQLSITVNTLLQGLWAIWLGLYTRKSQVVFGVTVSGRDAAVPCIETQVGVFINTLPFKVDVSTQSLQDWLTTIQCEFQQINSNSHIALAETTQFDSLLVFENYPISNEISELVNTFSIKFDQAFEQTEYPLELNAAIGNNLDLTLHYDPSLFRHETIQLILKKVEYLAEKILTLSPNASIDELRTLAPFEQQKLLKWTNGPTVDYKQTENLLQRYYTSIATNSQRIALVHNNQNWTYQTIDTLSNQLANHLRDHIRKKQRLIGLCMERSVYYLVGMLGILKIGAAFVPIDPTYPKARILHMFNDSQIEWVLISSQHTNLIEGHSTLQFVVLNEEQSQWRDASKSPITNDTVGEDWAYMMYTSGSTGRPKGALTHHAGALNHLYAEFDQLALWQGFNFLQSASASSDISVWQFLGPLLVGGKIIVLDDITNISEMIRLIATEQVTLLELVPVVINLLLDHVEENKVNINLFNSLKFIMAVGESLPISLVNRWLSLFPNIPIVNAYGPTEASDDVCQRVFVDPLVNQYRSIPIGQPLPNLSVMILDEQQKFCPIGAVGEICVSGIGVGPGYWRRPQQTANVFIPNYYQTSTYGKTIYRTGDFGRWNSLGELEYSGRLDHQVALHGYRIELDEIAAIVKAHAEVKDALVLLQEIRDDKKLVLYYVPQHKKILTEKAIRQRLQKFLPPYMIPGIIMELAKFPVAPSGKIARDALPTPQLDQSIVEGQYPQGKVEQALAEIWSDVLGVKSVRRDSSFFALGGHSIAALQVINRARTKNLHFTVRTLFDHPTICELAGHCRSDKALQISPIVEQQSFPLLPIQQMFFDEIAINSNHYNMSILLELKTPLKKHLITTSLTMLVEKHEALRLQFHCDEDQIWSQSYQPIEAVKPQLKVVKISDTNQYTELLQRYNDELQQSLSVTNGPLMAIAWFINPLNNKQHLLVVLHHLISDAISWQILLEDWYQIMISQLNKSPLQQAPRTHSVADWIKALQHHATKLSGQDEVLDYWLAIDKEADDSITALESENTFATDCDVIHDMTLSQPMFDQHTIFLTALLSAFLQWNGQQNLYLLMEGHGRENTFNEDIDVSRTVGWFTSSYPLNLKCTPSHSSIQRLVHIKSQLDQLPQHGFGYGVLRYFGHSKVRKQLSCQKRPKVTFNYLGQMAITDPGNALWSVSNEIKQHNDSDLGNRQLGQINFNIMEINKKLVISCSYNKQCFKSKSIEKLLQFYQKQIRQLSEENIEAIYSLSPTQAGMLYHHLFDPKSSNYFDQFCFHIPTKINEMMFFNAWQAVIDKYSILRTYFMWDGLAQPMQIVQKNYTLKPCIKTHISLQDMLQQDRSQPFELNQIGLIRLQLLRISENEYYFVISYPHILLDAWSIQLVLRDFMCAYQKFQNGKPLQLGHESPYRDYIHWLNRQAIDETYWKNYLAGFNQPTPIFTARSHQYITQQIDRGEYTIHLPEEINEKLEQISTTYDFTINVLFMGAWALLLRQYSGCEDVVFGLTVSGRQAPVSNINKMGGLFINTLPLRTTMSSQSVLDFFRAIQSTVLELNEVAFTPLSDIEKWSEIPNQYRLFDSILVFGNDFTEMNDMETDDAIQMCHLQSFEQTNYPIELNISIGESVEIHLFYDQLIYCNELIERSTDQFKFILHKLLNNLQYDIKKLNYLPNTITNQLLSWSNGPQKSYTLTESYSFLFEAQAARTPQAIAAVSHEQSINYRDLNAHANQIAHYLSACDHLKGQRIGLFLPRSITMLQCMLATLKLGMAFVPIDLDYPQDRIRHMMKDARLTVLLTDDNNFTKARELIDCTIISVSEIGSDLPTDNLTVKCNPNDLAYLIYTSGSTGLPKGVMIHHKGLINHIYAQADTLSLEDEFNFLQSAPASCDIAIWQFLGPLLLGGKTIIFVPNTDVAVMTRLIQEHMIHLVELVPSMIEIWLDYLDKVNVTSKQLCSLKYLMATGEVLPVRIANQWLTMFPNIPLINAYGPSEASDDVCQAILRTPLSKQQMNIPIGRPLPNYSVVVLDQQLNFVPIGVKGEIMISGLGVGLGYWEQEELTSRKFITNPHSQLHGEQLYKTGDVGYWGQDGQLHITGRLDDQVKIRGFRVDLNDITACLLQHNKVVDAIVISLKKEVSQLVAYVVNHDYSIELLKKYLKRQLPVHMVPAAWVTMMQLPRLPNGKVDKNALPLPTKQNTEVVERVLTTTESILHKIWCEVFNENYIHLDDDFFDRGGHSLLAIQIAIRVEQQFSLSLPIKDIYENSSILELARWLDTLATVTQEDNESNKNEVEELTV